MVCVLNHTIQFVHRHFPRFLVARHQPLDVDLNGDDTPHRVGLHVAATFDDWRTRNT